MKKRELGHSGIFVSEIGLGCMSLPTDKEEAKNIIDAALMANINFFDTADLYQSGLNEQFIGDAIKERREQIVLATKVGNQKVEGQDQLLWNASKEHIMKSVKESLQRLQTDHIDLYQLHGGTMEDNYMETIEAFETLKKEGVIRQYGISSIRPNVIKRFLENSSAVSVMMQYSLLDRRPEEWFPMIRANGASVLTRGTVAKGLLTNEGLTRIADCDGFGLYHQNELQDLLKEIKETAIDTHAAALAFNLMDDAIASLVIGASSKEQLLDTVVSYEKEIDRSILDKLKDITERHAYTDHLPETN